MREKRVLGSCSRDFHSCLLIYAFVRAFARIVFGFVSFKERPKVDVHSHLALWRLQEAEIREIMST